ncbi:uncharacterized protein LOC108920777 [Scleropages formosus]|uniref:uncharacterized protein LOC108920777 n=1 Tax=Scleropages formosus TaxID=113540 RepID=UPI000878B0C2|nr:uncharacterized protein LOC108920777 [Scleropages formosus]XP_018585329.1 uncharacterized protein LOC108920777 [Scleropages formosus]XP_018585330.1 uncharacterized protein LOC108920777 [Scleropages formosus]XP_018585331.1 uncharacterized protein LOC108920777 [Scleropages formosus]
MRATSWLESRWMQMPSEKDQNRTNSYYDNCQHVDNGNRTSADNCNYVGQSQSALYNTGSAYAGKYSLHSGSVADESPWNALGQIRQAEPVHLSLDSPSKQKSYQLNGGIVVPLESRDQSVTSVRCVPQLGQTLLQNGTLVPSRQNPQGLEITQEMQPCFSSLAMCNIPQGHMNNCFSGPHFQRLMDSGQVTTANSSFAQLPHPVEWNSPYHYMQWQSPMAGGMVNNRYVTPSSSRQRSDSTKAVPSGRGRVAPHARQATGPKPRLRKANMSAGTKSSEQGTIGSQTTGDGSRGGVNRVLCQNQSVAPPPTMFLNSNLEIVGVSSPQNIHMAHPNSSAVPSADGFSGFLQLLLQTNTTPDGISSTNRSTVRGSCSEANQKHSAGVEVPLLSSGPGLSAAKGNSSNSSTSCTSHGYSQTYVGQLPQNRLTKANGGVMTCDSGFMQQRDFVGMSCPRPAVQQQKTLQPLVGSGMTGSSLCQLNAGSLASVCHTVGHPSACTDENGNTAHPGAATGSSGQQSHTDQFLQPLSQQNSGKCRGCFVTATDDRKGSVLPADNVITESQPPVCSLSTQESTERVSEQSKENGNISRELDRTNISDDQNIELLVSETSAKMDVFKLPKANGQQSMPVGIGGQKAIAVVPPISQQSSVIDRIECAASAEGCLPCKIQSAWSLTGDSDGNKPHDEGSNLRLSQNGMDKVISGSFSDGVACRGKPAEMVSSLSNQQHSKSTNQGTLNMGSRNEISCSEFHSNSEGTARNNHNNKDDLENVFCLSTIPVSEWTIDNLRKLIAYLEIVETPAKYNKRVVSQIMDLFWGGDQKNLLNALCVGLYRTIFHYWEVSIDEKNPVVLSQFDNACMKKMAEKCHILEHGATFSETAYKSSWLHLNEKLDDIDMEHGFPMFPSFDVKMPGKGNQSSELNAIEQSKVIGPVTKTVDMDLQQMVLRVPATELPDPLSSIEIKVLPLEDAKKYFDSIASESGLTGERQNKELAQDSEKKDSQNYVYCCISKWIEVLNGQEENSLCRCQSQGSQKMETSDVSLKEKLEVTVESPLELSSGDQVIIKQENKGLDTRKDIKTITKECSVGIEAVQQSDDKKSISKLQILSPAGEIGLNVVEIKVEDLNLCHMEVAEVEASPSFQTGSTIPWISELHNPGCMNVNNCFDNGDAKKMGTDTTVDRRKFSNISEPPKSLGGFEPVSLRQRFCHRLCPKERLKHRDEREWKEGECKEKQKRTLHSKLPVQNLLHRTTEKEGEKVSACPQSVPGIKTHDECNNRSIVKVGHKQKSKKGESQVLSDVPKRCVRNCGKHRHAANGEVGKKLKKEISPKGTAATESSTIVSLTLYGSSLQPDHKTHLFQPNKSIPPATISLNISPHDKSISEKDWVKNSQAKQRVYSSWKSSWIPQKDPSDTKVLHSTRNGKEKARTRKPKETNTPNVALSEPNKGSLLKMKPPPSCSDLPAEAIDKREKDANKSHAAPSKPIRKGEDRAVLGSDKQTLLCSMKEKPQLPLTAIKRKQSEKGQNAHVSKQSRLQQSRRCNSVERCKYEIGNPALMPSPVHKNILKFKLLHKSFDLREAEDYEMEKKLFRQSKKTPKPQELEESTRQKTATWKIKGPWSHNLEKKEPVSDIYSSRMTVPSHTAYEEYRRQSLAKTRK